MARRPWEWYVHCASEFARLLRPPVATHVCEAAMPAFSLLAAERLAPSPARREALRAFLEDDLFRVAFTPEADERLAEMSKGITYRYNLTADVTDEGGETRSASKSTRLGLVSVEARANLDGEFVREGTEAQVTTRRTDLDGNPRAGKGSFRLLVLTEPAAPLLPSEEPIARSPLEEKTDAYRTLGDSIKPRWQTGWSWSATTRAKMISWASRAS